MNEDIMRNAGFKNEVNAIDAGRCPFCDIETNIDDFRDSLSIKEFLISGLCQKCQDDFYGKKEKTERKKPDPILGPNDILIKSCGMIKNKSRPITFERYIGKSRRIWMVGNCDSPSSEIYAQADPRENIKGYRGFRGYGGSTLVFRTSDNAAVQLQGPWHSNSNALYADTGIDVRDKCITFVVISELIEYIEERTNDIVMRNVLYKDEDPAIGPFDRGRLLAKEIATKLNKQVILYSESYGGSSCGPVKP